ncbi:hypothetical protein [Streptomyces sp. NPDC052701]|uniref:hypothetical protein n=1 Tax=Streptomyces sp. NPDC052701 TaxID=3155533 RepID=UPI003426BB3B
MPVMSCVVQVVSTGILSPISGEPLVERLAWPVPAPGGPARRPWPSGCPLLVPPFNRRDQAAPDPLWQQTGARWWANAAMPTLIAITCGSSCCGC